MQFFLYLIVGGLSFFVDIGSFIGLRAIEMPVILVSVAGFCLATTATLPSLAWSVLEAVPRCEFTDCVFGNGPWGFNGWHKAEEALDQRCQIAPWRLHDLRRTVATRMADIGIQPHVIEAVLNHVSGHKAGALCRGTELMESGQNK